mmetsp:Transcript_29075/g.58382  ORF Transcript_29075/g.58382 Transcript_29075/m.58382 type:complete len:179 (-) Transcript_29075:73-609(-)
MVIKPLSSSPSKGEGITTESDPVPNDAPTAILLQNSMVAHMNGMMPMMNTIKVVVGLSCSMTIGASSSCGGWGIMVVVVESTSTCVAAMSEDVEESKSVVIDNDVVVDNIETLCKSKLLVLRFIDAVVDANSGDDGMINAAALFLLRLEAAAAIWHCFSSARMDTRNASTRCVRLLPM